MDRRTILKAGVAAGGLATFAAGYRETARKVVEGALDSFAPKANAVPRASPVRRAKFARPNRPRRSKRPPSRSPAVSSAPANRPVRSVSLPSICLGSHT